MMVACKLRTASKIFSNNLRWTGHGARGPWEECIVYCLKFLSLSSLWCGGWTCRICSLRPSSGDFMLRLKGVFPVQRLELMLLTKM
jgi:hypothetical protein